MSDFLKNMASSSAQRAAAAPKSFSAAALDLPVFQLRLDDFDIIAEIKDRSPSEGVLTTSTVNRKEQARHYVDGGAAAISVLTEPSRFAGDLAHLQEVAETTRDRQVPVMRKDFLVDTVQILEAKAAGASGVLLIAAMLSDEKLQDMLSCAYEHSLFVLLESFDEHDLARTRRLLEQAQHQSAAENRQLLAGVNTRNLRTLEVDPSRLQNLSTDLPVNCVCVAESGLHSAADAASVMGWGYRMALVGTALMRSDNPRQLISAMIDAGRSAA
jgi:indole-3-glycerol phosphate synthase